MSLAGSTRVALVAALALTIAGCGVSAANPTPRQEPVSPAVASAEAPSAPPALVDPTPAADPTATAGATIYDTTALGPAFDLPLTMSLPEGWIAIAPPNDNPNLTIDLVKTGHPANDASQWWGFSLHLVDGASVPDPRDIAKSADVAKLPWPESYVDYLAALPGVEVVTAAGPTRIGGIDARHV